MGEQKRPGDLLLVVVVLAIHFIPMLGMRRSGPEEVSIFSLFPQAFMQFVALGVTRRSASDIDQIGAIILGQSDTLGALKLGHLGLGERREQKPGSSFENPAEAIEPFENSQRERMVGEKA